MNEFTYYRLHTTYLVDTANRLRGEASALESLSRQFANRAQDLQDTATRLRAHADMMLDADDQEVEVDSGRMLTGSWKDAEPAFRLDDE